jgi:hypothetical protein
MNRGKERITDLSIKNNTMKILNNLGNNTIHEIKNLDTCCNFIKIDRWEPEVEKPILNE